MDRTSNGFQLMSKIEYSKKTQSEPKWNIKVAWLYLKLWSTLLWKLFGNHTISEPGPEFFFSSFSRYTQGNNDQVWKESRLKGRCTGIGKNFFTTVFCIHFEPGKLIQQMAKPQFGKCLAEKIPGILHHDFNFDPVSNMSMKFYVNCKQT